MIDFFNLAAQQAEIKNDIDTRIARVLSHGKYILGPEVYELEGVLAEYTGAKHCISCANGTDALQISLMAIGIGPGDEVITPSFSYIAAAEAIKLLGAKPVFVDINPRTYNIDPDLIANKITPRTKAILPVSLYGQPADFDQIDRISEKYGLFVIEDAAQSFGGTYENKKSCNITQVACTSFFPTKPLGCYGDGGAIFTNDEQLARIIRQISRHGQGDRYHHVRLGVNSRLDSIQAAVLLAKLPLLDKEIDQRNAISSLFSSSLQNHPSLETPFVMNKCKSAWAQYTISAQNREALIKELNDAGIPIAIHYPRPLYEQPVFFRKTDDCPLAEYASKHVLSLPINAYLNELQIEKIINVLCDHQSN